MTRSTPPSRPTNSTASSPALAGPDGPEPPAPGDEEAAEETTESSKLPFAVAGIGASAGGLEALEALTKRLSADHMAFVVIQHLAPAT